MQGIPGKSLQGTGKLSAFIALLGGHFSKLRDPALYRYIVEWIERPRPATNVILGAISLTVRMRRAVRLSRLSLRTHWSTAVFRFRHRSDGAGVNDPPHIKSMLCPTRSRAGQIGRFVRSVQRTCTRPESVEILFYVDDDDPQVGDYQRTIKDLGGLYAGFKRIALIVGPAMSVSKSWNVLAADCSGDLLMMANDDQLYVDYGWDHQLDRHAGESRDGIFAMFFEDGQYPPGSGDFPIVSRRWYETLGYFTPGIFEFWYNEAWIFDIAQRLRRIRRIPGILVDHLHYSEYKAMLDETYLRHRSNFERSKRDAELFKNTADERKAAAEKLRPLMIEQSLQGVSPAITAVPPGGASASAASPPATPDRPRYPPGISDRPGAADRTRTGS